MPASPRDLTRRLAGWLRSPASGASEMRLGGWLFLRLLGLVYLAAFVSLGVQVQGLIGSRGISPVARYLEAARRHFGGASAWTALPTIFWVDASDRALGVACGAGALVAALVVAGILEAPALALCWALYLSLVVAGQEFLSFQWDVLLLETGFLALLLAPLRLGPKLPGREPPPPRAAVLLLRWLLFRVMFSSGAVKLLSGDPAWRDLSALGYHYQTQPLPTWIGWYAHQLPAGVQRLSCGLMFATELLVPFLVFAPRRARGFACLVLVGFQALIAVTGNYGFFNLLTAALCLLLVDDPIWPRALRDRLLVGGDAPARGRRWPRAVVLPVALVLLALSLVPLLALAGGRARPPALLLAVYRRVAPFDLVSSYGLFAVMTTSRHEIALEGSDDGVDWKRYEFRFKPGDPARRPAFVAPHMPRLDWQMWFAALGTYGENRWLVRLAGRLLEGSPEVVALLAVNPFPEAPPRYVRATLEDYRFTDRGEKRATGRWWRVEAIGPYLPVLTRPGPGAHQAR